MDLSFCQKYINRVAVFLFIGMLSSVQLCT